MVVGRCFCANQVVAEHFLHQSIVCVEEIKNNMQHPSLRRWCGVLLKILQEEVLDTAAIEEYVQQAKILAGRDAQGDQLFLERQDGGLEEDNANDIFHDNDNEN